MVLKLEWWKMLSLYGKLRMTLNQCEHMVEVMTTTGPTFASLSALQKSACQL